jgi:tRNA U34 5-methylaminomethyl-2-thiouridine-forming methyltransferase MnmC
MRYNAELSYEGLAALELSHINPEEVQKLDSVDHIEELQEVGRAVAKQVNIAHFADCV